MSAPQFLGEALAEYEDAVVYYERRQPGLGARFVLEVDEALALAAEFPEAGAVGASQVFPSGFASPIVRSR